MYLPQTEKSLKRLRNGEKKTGIEKTVWAFSIPLVYTAYIPRLAIGADHALRRP